MLPHDVGAGTPREAGFVRTCETHVNARMPNAAIRGCPRVRSVLAVQDALDADA